MAKQIDEVEEDINNMRSAKPEHWQIEVEYLRYKEEQLREEKLALLSKSVT